jgi:hypothetical protein
MSAKKKAGKIPRKKADPPRAASTLVSTAKGDNLKAEKIAAIQSKGGRPSKFTEAILDDICERLSKGEPLAAICRDEGYPHPNTVRDWTDRMTEVSVAIARAREAGEDVIAADCLNIADDNGKDIRYTEMGIQTDHDVIQRSKLRIETRLKLLAKWNPKKYGDKLDLTSTGERINPPAIILSK